MISTLNVQHLESFYHVAESIIGVKVHEQVPDSVLNEADQVVNIDITEADLQERLREGKIYPTEKDGASSSFFTGSHLERLRQMTLHELASQLAFEQTGPEGEGAGISGAGQVMVCVSLRCRCSERLLRFGAHLAGRSHRKWYAIHVRKPSEASKAIRPEIAQEFSDMLTLGSQLGAEVLVLEGKDIVGTILQFAHEKNVGEIVIGRPGHISWWQRVWGERRIAEELIHRSKGVTVLVVDTGNDEQ